MNCIIVDYVWIDGNMRCRSKTRVLKNQNIITKIRGPQIDDIPVWNYDGSSTNQAHGKNSEISIHPRCIFRSPFYTEYGDIPAYIVMCDTYDSTGQPAKNNNRHSASIIFDRYSDELPWYGLEQEYFIYSRKTNQPIGLSPDSHQGPYYCGVGGQYVSGREIVDRHLMYCLMMGIQISGTNAEVAPGQWEFQIGPVEGIEAADQLWVARYVLERLSEQYETYIVYHPKPLEGDWNGSGCHTNFSTEKMRQYGGADLIKSVMTKFESAHAEHMDVYGADNIKRMSGLHETSSYKSFTYGVGDRTASIRIPFETITKGRGYLEDRRPAANMDPYLVTAKILETVMSD